jgi:hypothetical protein
MKRTASIIGVLAVGLSGCMSAEPLATNSESLSSDWVDMQIVAHQDDDFLFMNPDLRNAIAAGHSIVTVYLTAGQASGTVDGTMCTAEFANARQLGIKAAYAHMAFPAEAYPDELTWSRELVVPDLGATWPHTVERYTLDADPMIKLIFMNIPDGGASIGDCGYGSYTNALINLFEDPSYVTDTIVPDCGPTQGYGNYLAACQGTSYPNPFICNSFEGCSPSVPWQNYDHDGVAAVLTGLINTYQPVLVRTLDPLPFSLPGLIDYDNTDHTGVGRFVDEVLASYHGPNGTGRYSLIHYKGYGFMAYPPDLGTYDRTDKRNTAMVYQPFDPNFITYSSAYEPYYPVMYERYPANTNWLERASDGRLVAVSVEDRQVKFWVESSVGGSWTGPTTLATSSPVSPNVTLLKRPDGKLQIFAMRLPLERETWGSIPLSAPRQDIITAIQNTGTTISFGVWETIGAPGPGIDTRAYGTATASSIESSSYPASNAVDGSTSTRWSSTFSDPQWITIDLRAVYPISHVTLRWETAYATAYRIQVSNNNSMWTDVVNVTNGNGGVDDWAGLAATGQYVRMYGTTRATAWGYSLYEFEVYVPETGQMNGIPTAAYDGLGRTFIFAKNSDGRVAYTYSDGSSWGPWHLIAVNEQDIIDGIAAITRDDGVIEVFATARSGQIQHFVQSGSTTSFTDMTSTFNFTASSAPTVTKNQDGRLEIFYREINDPNDSSRYGRVVTAWVNTSGQWIGGSSGGGVLYGDAGVGPVAAIRRGVTGHIMLFERNVDGRISSTWQQAPNSSFILQWAVLGGPGEGQLLQEYASAATDDLGRVVTIVKATNGRMYINRESSSSTVGSFAGWLQVGN